MANGGQIKYGIGFNVDKSGLNEARSALQEIQRLSVMELKTITGNNDMTKLRNDIEIIQRSAGQLENALNKAFNQKLGTINVQKFNQELKKSNITLDQIYNGMAQAGSIGVSAFRKVSTQLLTTNMQLKQSYKLLDSMAETMGNTVKWGIASSALNNFTGSIQQAYGYVKNLDTSLNNIRIVTEKSADEMDRFATKANKAAKALGQSTTAYTDAALIYYQQGLAEEEVIARADTTLKAANVTGQAAADVSEQLTAVWNGFKVGAEETELYVDKLAAVAATTAADLEELSTGMSKVASAANAMGVDIDQLNGHLATVVSVTRQAPESVGTAFKTIYARLGDLAVGGEDEFGVKLGEVSGKLKTMGIEILDQQGNMRDMGTVMEEVAAKWGEWTEAQRQAAAVAMAGKRQYNNLIALFDNWDMYTDAVNTSKNAMGTLQTQQDIYMESTEAHLQKMRTAWEGVYDSMLDTDTINFWLDAFTGLGTGVEQLIDALGGGNSVLLLLGATATKVFDRQLATGIQKLQQNFKNAKDNAVELQAQLELIELFGADRVGDEYVKQLAETKKKFLELNQVMTAEDHNRINNLLLQKDAIRQQEEAWEAELQVAAEYVSTLENATVTVEELKNINREKSSENYFQADSPEAYSDKTILDNLTTQKQTLEEAERGLKKYSNQVSAAVHELDKLSSGTKKYNKVLEKGEDELKEYQSTLRELITNGSLSKTDQDMLTELFDNAPLLEQGQQDWKEYAEKVEAALEKIKRKNQEVAKIVEKESKGMSANLANANANIDKVLDNEKNAKTLTKNIQNTVHTIGSLGQMASAIQSIAHLGDIITNEDLDIGEKILQIVISLGFALPSLLASLKDINKIFGIETTIKGAAVAANEAYLNTLIKINAERILETGTMYQKASVNRILQQLQAGDITATKALIKLKKELALANMEVAGGATAAGKATKGFLSTLGAIGWIAIGAGVILAIAKAFNKEILTTEKQLENQKQALDAVKKSYDGINQSLETYNNATAAMDKATKGTKEWNDALQEANNTLLELIEKYPQLAKYVKMGDNGQLYITDEDALLEAQNKAMNAAQRAYYGAQANAQESLGKQQQSRLANGITLTDGYSPTGTGQTSTLSKSELQLILDKIETNGVGFLKDKESFKAIMGDSLDDSVIDKVLLEENKDAIIELSNQLKSNSHATELYTEQIADSFLRERGISNTGPLKGIYGEELNRVRDEKYEELKQESDADIREAYRTLIGATEVRDEDGEIQYKIGDEWTAIEDDAARMALAMEKAGEATQDYANDLVAASEGMRGSDNYKEALLGFGANGEADLSYLSTKELEDLENISDEQITNLANVFDTSGDDLREKIKQGLSTERTKRDEETTRQIGEASGDFNKYLDELVSGGYMSSAQKGSFKTEEWLGQVDKSLLQDAAARGISVEDILTEVDMSQIINAENVGEAFKNAVSAGAEKLIQDQIAQEKIAQIVQEGVSQGLEAEEMEEYATHLMEVAESSEILSDDLKDNEEAANRVARATMRMNKGMDAIVENFESWSDILRNSDEASEEYADAMSDLRDAISDVLDIDDPGMLSHEFLSSAETLDLLEQAAKGSEEALEELQIAAGRDIVANIDFAPEINEEEILSKYDEMMALMPDLKVGAELDDGAFLDALNELILSSGMTADEVNALLGTMRLDAEFNTTEVEQTQTVPRFIIRRVPTGRPFEWAETSYQDGVDTFTGKVQVPSLGVNGEPPITKITRTSAPSLGNHSSTNAGGKKSSGGGSSKPKKQDKIEEEIDRYHDINIEIKNLSKEMERLEEAQDHLFGKDLLDNLNKQLEVLDKQVLAAEKKLAIAKEEQEELQKTLSAEGVTFENGLISNYESIIKAKQDEYNALVDRYNGMSAEEQEVFQDTLDAAKEDLDEFLETIERYDELVVDEIPSLVDEIIEAAYKEIELNLEKLNIEIELRLDLVEAIKDWEEFEREVIKGLEDTDFAGYAQSYSEEFTDLIGSGLTEALTGKINEALADVQNINSDSYRGMFGAYGPDGEFIVDEQAAMEYIQTAQDELMQHLTDIHELQEQINESYLNNIDKIEDAYQDLSNLYSFIDDQLNHSLNVIKLLKGEEAYEDMAKFYEQQVANNEQLLATQVAQRDYYKEMMEKETDPEAAKKWEELWMNSVQDVNATVEQSLELINQQYVNSVQQALKVVDDALGGTRTLRAQWDVAVDQDDRWLDGVNTAYNLATLENKFNESINSVDSIKGQRELNKLKEEELEKLREKDKLTQYDIDRANQMLDIEMKRIALEEAQKNKSKMRLRRDSSGNYSYQFVADEEAQAQAEQELMDAQNSLYNMDKDHLREQQEEMFSIWQEYQDLQTEYASLSIEERALREEEFATRFANLQQAMTDIAADCEWTQLNLAQSTFDSLGMMYEEDGIKFTELNAEKQRQLVEELGPTFTTTIDTMIDAINNPESGYQAAWVTADQMIYDANKQVEQSIADIEAALGLTEGDGLRNTSSSYYTEAIEGSQDLITEQEDLLKIYQDEQIEIGKIKVEVDNLAAAWDTVYQNAINALEAAQEYITTSLATGAEQAQTAPTPDTEHPTQTGGNGAGSGGNSSGGNTSSGSGGGSGSSKGGGSELNGSSGSSYSKSISDPNVQKLQELLKTVYAPNLKVDGVYGEDTKKAVKKMQQHFNSLPSLKANLTEDGLYGKGTRDELSEYMSNIVGKKYKASKMDASTAGYYLFRVGVPAAVYKKGGLADFTGPAWLDGTKSQPELVLNAGDTENMLSIIEMVRDIMAGSGSSDAKSDDPTTRVFEYIKMLISLTEELRDKANVETDNLITLADVTNQINKAETLGLADAASYYKDNLGIAEAQIKANKDQVARFAEEVDAAVNKINAESLEKFTRISNSMKDMTAVKDNYNDLLQDIKIYADFPDVTNAEEIKAAFNNLVNMASQRAYSTKK